MTEHTYQDGSTRRHIRRADCQLVCIALRAAWEDEDGLAMHEAWDELRNDAERDWVWGWLTVAQREALRAALRVSDVSGGW